MPTKKQIIKKKPQKAPKKQKTAAKRAVAKAVKDNDFLNVDELFDIAEDVDKYGALRDVYESPGGQVLIDTMVDDIISQLTKLSTSYSQMTLAEFIAFSARVSNHLSIIRSLHRSVQNYEGANETLKEALLE